METKKNAAALSAVLVIAFAAQAHAAGDVLDDLAFDIGDRLELTEADFAALEKADLVERGVCARMLDSVELDRQSLPAGADVYLRPAVFEAWRAAGICEPSDASPEMRARVEDLAEARGKLSELGAKLQAIQLDAAAAADLVGKLCAAASPLIEADGESDVTIDGVAACEIRDLLRDLVDMLPDTVDAPELALI